MIHCVKVSPSSPQNIASSNSSSGVVFDCVFLQFAVFLCKLMCVIDMLLIRYSDVDVLHLQTQNFIPHQSYKRYKRSKNLACYDGDLTPLNKRRLGDIAELP